MVHDSP